MIVLTLQLLAPEALKGLCGILLEKEALRRKVRAKDLRPRATSWLRKESVFAKRLRGRGRPFDVAFLRQPLTHKWGKP